MSRRKNVHYPELEAYFEEYGQTRGTDYHRYSEYHMRLMDGGFNVLDVWTTARYYVLTTDYLSSIGEGSIERGGEKGMLPTDKEELFKWLDAFFYEPEKVKINA